MDQENNLEKPHILLVEDTPSLSRMYQSSLEKEGYAVLAAGTAEMAFQKLTSDKVDLILLDLKLPDLDGLTALEEIRKNGHNQPVIVITGHGSINVAVEAMRSGARDFLLKPFNIERLLSAIKSELASNAKDSVPPFFAGIPPERQDSLNTLCGQAGDGKASTPSPENTLKDDHDNHAWHGLHHQEEFQGFIGTSPIMLKLYEQIECAARSNATVFITGESGTGKEVCAETIHKRSSRAGKAFIPINCAAIPRDLMESELFGHVKGAFTGAIAEREGAASLANGGTLFLDEIAEMSPDMQTKLLRFLQNFTFQKVGGGKLIKTDVRIICATNRNPLEEVRTGRFREDLFYRLHVLPVYMPPLRDRGEDVIDIALTFLRRYAKEENKAFSQISPEVENILRRYKWPGNIRQLQNVLRHTVVMHEGEILEADMLPMVLLHQTTHEETREVSSSFLSKCDDENNAKKAQHPFVLQPSIRTSSEIRSLAEVEKRYIEQAILACGNNIPKAAAMLGVSPSTIYRKKTGWEHEDKGREQSAA